LCDFTQGFYYWVRAARAAAPPKAARAAASVAAAAAAPLSGIATAPSGVGLPSREPSEASEVSAEGFGEASGASTPASAASPCISQAATPSVSRQVSTGADAGAGADGHDAGLGVGSEPAERLAALLRLLPGGDALAGSAAEMPRTQFSAPEEAPGGGLGFGALNPRSNSLPAGALSGLARTLSRVHRRGDSFSSMRHLEGEAMRSVAAQEEAAAAAEAAAEAEAAAPLRPLVFIHGVGLGLVRRPAPLC